MADPIEIRPLTSGCWPDIEILFGQHGAYAGCWCMFWRLERAEFKRLKGEGTRAVLKGMVEQGEVPGLLAYAGGVPAGWVSVGPRKGYRALEASRILKRLDDQPVWSIVCFFVAKPSRQQGLMYSLVRAARDYALSQGAAIVEGYPIDMQNPKLAGQKLGSYSGYMGIASAYRQNGFVEAGRASETQLIVRYQKPE